MKKIINGKKYDTDTAEQIAEIMICDNKAYTDAQSEVIKAHSCEYNCYFVVIFHEGLFKKKDGEYFLAKTNITWDKDMGFLPEVLDAMEDIIKPVTMDEAKTWTEKYLSADIYEREFGVISDT